MSDSADHAVAVIGLSCRLPQASDPTGFWNLLRQGRSAITEAPTDRWRIPPRADDAAADPSYPRFGGFLSKWELFDAAFFGISPREAAGVDPQQRLMLELAWEALENAGIIPGELSGTHTGVFVGAIWDDYAALLLRQDHAGRTA